MPDERIERRLAAILAADVVGYSRLMGADEEGTLAALKSHRLELINPMVAEYRGRVVKSTGDGALVEFGSAVDAVRCALDIQRAMIERNATTPADRRIEFRIGINVGDVIIDEGDVFGDGVNIAARIEPLAEPGAICISDNAYRQIKGALPLSVTDLGEQHLKNIIQPVRVYRVHPDFTPAPHVTVPEKPSIAVLPFVNMSGDAEQEYFADGMVDEIITALSRLRWLLVAARTSSFEFKGRAVDIREIARHLNVRYILEGSVRKSGNRVRIIGQLIDGATGEHLWADRFDGEMSDIFDLQDTITERVVGAIEPTLRSAEIERAKRKRPESLVAYDYYLRALPHFYASTRQGSEEGLALIDRALALDPGFAQAKALAAWFYFNLVTHGWSAKPGEDSAKGAALARAALEAHTDDPMALANAGWVLATLGRDLENGVAAIDRAIALYPNTPYVLNLGGWIMTFVGDQQRALQRLQRALELSPSDPLAYRFLTGAAVASLLMGKYEDAARLAEEARKRHTKWGPTFRTLAVAYGLLGQSNKAAEAAARLLECEPSATISRYRAILPYKVAEQAGRLWEGLRKVGIPE